MMTKEIPLNDEAEKAFPFQVFTDDSRASVACMGMDLRDYFATQAMHMHGMALSGMGAASPEEWDRLIARRAYETADAMMKAREAR